MDIYDDQTPLVLIFGRSKVSLETGTPQKFHVFPVPLPAYFKIFFSKALKHLVECRTEEGKKKSILLISDCNSGNAEINHDSKDESLDSF